MPHDVYATIPAVISAFASVINSDGKNHSQSLDHSLVPSPACQRKRTEIPHIACLATLGPRILMEHSQLL